MSNTTNTTVVNKHIVFLKDDAGWYADMEGTRAQNAMVSGADTMIEALSGGGRRNAGEAPQFRGIFGLPLAWLCNQTHRFIGGEHPKDIFVHAITNN